MPGSNSRPNVSEGYEVPTDLPGSTGISSNSKPHSSMVISYLIITDHGEEDAGRGVVGLKRDGAEGEMLCCFKRKRPASSYGCP